MEEEKSKLFRYIDAYLIRNSDFFYDISEASDKNYILSEKILDRVSKIENVKI
jgi:hypothetical protein